MSEPLEPQPTTAPPPPTAPRVVESEALFDGSREVLISHHDQVYRLRITRSGKLILQK